MGLGIVNSYVLDRCHSLEEAEHLPHRREAITTPLGEFKKEADRAFERFEGALLKLPDREKIKLYPLFQTILAYWMAYSQAVERKEDHVRDEIYRPRRGPTGKSLQKLLEEQESLDKQINDLLKRQQEGKLDAKSFLKLVKPLNSQLAKIDEKLERDYGQ
jgi:predicted RNase H-like nuclease (RuvC/YqgF family)